MPPSSPFEERLNLMSRMNALPLATFNKLVFVLSPPPGLLPPPSAPQSDRVCALMEWARGTGGCGLERVISVLEVVSSTVSQEQTSVNLERLWNVPYERNAFFTGRDTQLGQLHEALQNVGKAAVSGMPGVGKTQLAIEYAYLQREEYRYVFWVKAETQKC